MIRLIAQLILTLAVVEFVPADISHMEMAHLPMAGEGRPIIQEMNLLQRTLPIDLEMRAPIKMDLNSLGIKTSAASALVVDNESGLILFEKNIDEIRPIGSLVKLMAAAVFLEQDPNLDAPVSVQPEDIRYGGRDHLYIDDMVTIRDLFESSLVGSDNPATISLMRVSGLSTEQFVARMNELAKEWGMENTHFTEPTGLDSKNVSTAREIVLLLEHVLDNPLLRDTTQKNISEFTSASGRNYRIPTTNALLTTYLNASPFEVLGGKTGFLPSAGYNLAVLVNDGEGHGVYSIVLGSKSLTARFQEVKGLTQWAFDVFSWPDELARL